MNTDSSIPGYRYLDPKGQIYLLKYRLKETLEDSTRYALNFSIDELEETRPSHVIRDVPEPCPSKAALRSSTMPTSSSVVIRSSIYLERYNFIHCYTSLTSTLSIQLDLHMACHPILHIFGFVAVPFSC